MADSLIWLSFLARRAGNPLLADTMLTLYATTVLIVLSTMFLYSQFTKPRAAPPAAEAEAAADDPPSPLEPAEDDHLTWQPLRLVPLDHNAYHQGQPQPIQPAPGEHTIYDIWGREIFDGTEASDDFLLSDLKLGESVLAGYTTSNKWAYGVVTGYKEGQYFTFDGPNEGSLLWNQFLLLRGPMAEEALEHFQRWRAPVSQKGEGEESPMPPPAPLKRTDSGTNYGFAGYPDVAFWKRSGAKQLFWKVTADEYHEHPGREERYHEQIRELREMLADPQLDIDDLEREAMEQQAEWLRAQVWSYATVETVGDEAREKEILERLGAAWDLREEGEIVE